MSTRLVCLLCGLLVVSTAGAALGQLVGQWQFDEGSGSVANDGSGHGHRGTILGTPVWVPGPGGVGTALSFNPATCTGVDCGVFDPTNGTGKFTLAFWAYWDGGGTYQHFFTKSSGWGTTTMMFQVELWGAHPDATYTDRVGISYDPVSVPFSKMPKKEWAHLAFVYDGANLRLYLNGIDELGPKAFTIGANMSAPVLIGRDYDGGRVFNGMMDDVRVYGQVLSAAEVKAIMTGPAKLASSPSPADGATDVLRDASLSWQAGKSAGTHDVYLGQVFADVNNASRTQPAGLLASQGRADTTFDPPGSLAYGQTYYWRIDEVNQTPDNTIFKGNVWSFTVETYGVPVTPVAATASTAQPGAGPENTINGSGLTSDLHGTDGATMWLTAGTPPNWIQYQFDRVYKLSDLKVWNYNGTMEAFIGFGAKDVKIEYSTDGTTWTALANVPPFGRAPGLPGYAANTTVSFGGAMAQYVKLTINANWGGMSPVTGLSEVRFSYVPVQARLPQPATGATNQSLTTTLSWRPGREAASHTVFFGTDQAAVTNGTAAAQTVTAHAFDPGPLAYGTTYYWRVDEVNTVTYPGEVWSFATKEYDVVDDFESYNEDKDRIYDTWIDGAGDGLSGSYVGYNPTAAQLAAGAHFAETTIVHGGKQSMPLEYNNVKTPYFSEATRTFDTPQDWSTHGADTLTLWFRGRPMGFVESAPGALTMSGTGTDIWNTSDQFRFACKPLSGNGSLVAKVESLDNTDPWAKAGVMIRDSLDPAARFAAVYATPGNGVRYQARLVNAGSATSDTTLPAASLAAEIALKIPVWIKIERVGTSFNGYYSTDGVKWTAMPWNPQTIALGANVYIGLAVTSHTAAATTVAQFSGVATTGNVTGTWTAQAIGVAQPTNDPAPLYVTVQDNTGKGKTVVHPDPAATNLASWQQWRLALNDFSAAGVKLPSVKKLIIGIGDKTSPKAGGAGLIFLDDIGCGHPIK